MIFHTNDTKYKYRNGEYCKKVSIIVVADTTHDAEVLPMYIIEFNDGFQLEVFPDELDEGQSK